MINTIVVVISIIFKSNRGLCLVKSLYGVVNQNNPLIMFRPFSRQFMYIKDFWDNFIFKTVCLIPLINIDQRGVIFKPSYSCPAQMVL